MRKNSFSDRVILFNFEAEGQKFENFLRSLEQFIQTGIERSEQFLAKECIFKCSWRFLISVKLEQSQFKFEEKIGI